MSKRTKKSKDNKDKYTIEILIQQYEIHKSYTISRITTSKELNIKIRLPSIPEDISENIIKFIIHKHGDKSSSWSCKGDLISKTEGIQECKCFTSTGPLSFTPVSEWDVIYFLDAREWLSDKLILYKCTLKRSSDKWKSLKVNARQTFEDQCLQRRRPRLSWNLLYSQLKDNIEKIFEGTFDDIFTK